MYSRNAREPNKIRMPADSTLRKFNLPGSNLSSALSSINSSDIFYCKWWQPSNGLVNKRPPDLVCPRFPAKIRWLTTPGPGASRTLKSEDREAASIYADVGWVQVVGKFPCTATQPWPTVNLSAGGGGHTNGRAKRRSVEHKPLWSLRTVGFLGKSSLFHTKRPLSAYTVHTLFAEKISGICLSGALDAL